MKTKMEDTSIKITNEIREGFETAYIDHTNNSNLAYTPEFVSNDYTQGKKVLSSLEKELSECDEFIISVAFITLGGITPLLQVLKEIRQKGIKGKILTTDYMTFSEPKALEKLLSFENIELKIYPANDGLNGFHTKGYIFKKGDFYNVIVGSSNITQKAITSNYEWNTKFVSTENGSVLKDLLSTTIYLWLITLTASRELSILLLSCIMMEQSVCRLPFLDISSVIQTDNQLLICSVRFMQVESPLVHSCHTTVDRIGNE